MQGNLTQFLDKTTVHARSLRRFLLGLAGRGSSVCVFGGTLRDLSMYGANASPRDIDVVVTKLGDLAPVLQRGVWRQTRFGGLEIQTDGWELDLWEISQTWAFKNSAIAEEVENLPKTTFLNTQAVVAEIPLLPWVRPRIYSHGFFEAIEARTVEVNFEPNPFPQLCILAALTTASRLGFGLGKRILRYVAEHWHRIDLQELVDYQVAHKYSQVHCQDTLYRWLKCVDAEHRVSSAAPLHLPLPCHR